MLNTSHGLHIIDFTRYLVNIALLFTYYGIKLTINLHTIKLVLTYLHC